jgi:multiple sugar transport system ATP-binding protein
MASVSIRHLTKEFGTSRIVSDINLDIRDKEFVVLVGPSGCGKSTTLRMIAGLESITSGELWIDDKLVNEIAPKDRDIAMVFQNYALYPHMTVFQNMAFGLTIKGIAKEEINKRVEVAAAVVGLTDYLKRKPGSLSGGQRQRVALGRAIVRNPKVFLFDEPLSNLDARLRVQMRLEITRLQRKLGVTTIYVTHDQVEAMTMADRIAVMKDGVLQQFDTPVNTYNKPVNLFVAGFIGSPSMNFIPVKQHADQQLQDADGNFSIDMKGYLPGSAAENLVVGIRPEDIHSDNGLSIPAYHPVTVLTEAIEPIGSDSFLYGKLGSNDIIARIRPDAQTQLDQPTTVYMDRSRIHIFDAVSGMRLD